MIKDPSEASSMQGIAKRSSSPSTRTNASDLPSACLITAQAWVVITPAGFSTRYVYSEGKSSGSSPSLIDLRSTIRRPTRTPAFQVSLETTSPTAMILGGFSSRTNLKSLGTDSEGSPVSNCPSGFFSLAISSGLGRNCVNPHRPLVANRTLFERMAMRTDRM